MLLSAYGSEILYALFMQPHSAVVELYPPFWDWSHYKRFSLNAGLLHRAYKAKGEQGPQCKKRAQVQGLSVPGNARSQLHRGHHRDGVDSEGGDRARVQGQVQVFHSGLGVFVAIPFSASPFLSASV